MGKEINQIKFVSYNPPELFTLIFMLFITIPILIISIFNNFYLIFSICLSIFIIITFIIYITNTNLTITDTNICYHSIFTEKIISWDNINIVEEKVKYRSNKIISSEIIIYSKDNFIIIKKILTQNYEELVSIIKLKIDVVRLVTEGKKFLLKQRFSIITPIIIIFFLINILNLSTCDIMKSQSYLIQNKLNMTIDIYNSILRYNPNADTYNNLAWIYATVDSYKDSDKAIEYALIAAYMSDWNYGYIIDTLAESYYSRGDCDLSIKYIKYAIKLEPQNYYYKRQLKKFQTSKNCK